MSIEVQCETNNEHCPSTRDIQAWITATLKKIKKSGTLSIMVIDEKEMQALNFKYRKKDKPTNVLSFPCHLPIELKGDILGDIVVCAPIVEMEAQSQQKPLINHWAHMIVHGVLHLLGYDHEKEEDAKMMEQHEIDILADLGFSNPYQVEIIHD